MIQFIEDEQKLDEQTLAEQTREEPIQINIIGH